MSKWVGIMLWAYRCKDTGREDYAPNIGFPWRCNLRLTKGIVKSCLQSKEMSQGRWNHSIQSPWGHAKLVSNPFTSPSIAVLIGKTASNPPILPLPPPWSAWGCTSWTKPMIDANYRWMTCWSQTQFKKIVWCRTCSRKNVCTFDINWYTSPLKIKKSSFLCVFRSRIIS